MILIGVCPNLRTNIIEKDGDITAESTLLRPDCIFWGEFTILMIQLVNPTKQHFGGPDFI